MKSKTIILSALNSHDPRAGRGILTVSKENDSELKCKLRLYNISSLSTNCKLGMYYQSEVFGGTLANRTGCYEASFSGNFDIDKDFYFAVVNPNDSNSVVIAGGTYSGCFFEDSSVFDEITGKENKPTQNFEQNKQAQNNEDIINTNPILNDSKDPTNCNLEETECDKCAHCKYKEFFYDENLAMAEEETKQANIEQPAPVTNLTQKLNEESIAENPQTNASIFAQILPQFDYIFENYQQNEELNNLIENSKFVKVEEGTENYSIGAIYENNEMKYICYAVRSNYNAPLPAELGKFHQWLPIDAEDPLSDGYHIVFQDAHDLKIIEV